MWDNMTVHKEHTSGTPLYTPSWWYTLGKFWYTLGCTIHPVDKHWARTFILLLLSIILVKSFFFICEDTRPIVSTATVVLCKTRRMSMECLFFVI